MPDKKKTKAELICELESLRRRLSELEETEKHCRRQAEEASRGIKGRYQELADASLTAISLVQDGKIRFVNKTFVEMSGYGREELLGKSSLELVHPDDRDLAQEAAARRLSGQDPTGHYNYRVVTKNGDTLWIETFGTVVEYQGRPAILLNIIDISEHKLAEEKLKESEQRYRTLVEEARDIIVTIDLKTGTISSANSYGEEILGYKREDVLGKRSFLELIHPDEQVRVTKKLQERIESGQRDPNFPFRLRKADGSYIEAEINGSVIYDNEGNPDSYLGVIRDLTERTRAEKALRFTQFSVDHSADPAFWVGRDARFIYVNDAACRSLGYSREELLTMTVPDIDPDMPAEAWPGHWRDLKERGSFSFESHHLTKDGRMFPVEMTVNFLQFEGEEYNCAFAHNITERKLAEQELRASEERYSTLLDSVEVSFFETDLAGNITFFNDAVRRGLGYSPTELLGLNYKRYIDEENAKIMYRVFNEVYRTGEPNKGFVSMIVKRDGTKAPREYSVSLLRDSGGEPVGFRGVARDIGERVKAEEQLRESEKKYRTLFEESKDVIYISTPDGKLLDINPAGVELFGYSSKEELLRIDIVRDLYLDPNDRDAFQMAIVQQGFVKDYELAFKKRDGQPVTVLVTANAVKDDSGRMLTYRGIMRDITEKKRLEQQLLQAQKMESVGTLAGGIAHDFNNILGGILGYASFMKTKMEEGHPFFRYVDTIERSSIRAAELTSQLLAFARGGKYNVSSVNVNKIVDETIRMIARTFDKSIEIRTHLHPRLPMVEADSGQLLQVLMNLCVNAGDVMPAGGELTIETDIETLTEEDVKLRKGAQAGSYVCLTVTDTGIGMDRETQQRIFEPFFTTKKEGKGTGLGLSMVYGVVKNHGGLVRVHSDVGRGTTFKIYLPVSEKPQTEEASETDAPLGGDEWILVVDDEEPIRSFVKDVLESNGYRVLSAENGAEAVSVYKEHDGDIDLVLLDMVMPRMGGHETFLRLRTHNPGVKALLCTGYSEDGKAQEILKSGVMGFIQKPYQGNTLLSKVRTTLDTRVGS